MKPPADVDFGLPPTHGADDYPPKPKRKHKDWVKTIYRPGDVLNERRLVSVKPRKGEGQTEYWWQCIRCGVESRALPCNVRSHRCRCNIKTRSLCGITVMKDNEPTKIELGHIQDGYRLISLGHNKCKWECIKCGQETFAPMLLLRSLKCPGCQATQQKKADYISPSIQAVIAAREEAGMKNTCKKRSCLSCGCMFDSVGPANRICASCRRDHGTSPFAYDTSF